MSLEAKAHEKLLWPIGRVGGDKVKCYYFSGFLRCLVEIGRVVCRFWTFDLDIIRVSDLGWMETILASGWWSVLYIILSREQ